MAMEIHSRKEQTMVDYAELYKNDRRFRRYVDCCAKDSNVPPEVKLQEKVIQSVGDYYAATPERVTESTTTINCGCGGGC